MHDWVFVRADMSWEKAELTLVLDPFALSQYPLGSEQVFLIAQGMRLFHCPREDEWGPSVFILDANLNDCEQGKKLSIEMQTGDTIEIVARGFVLPAGTGLPKALEGAK